MKICEIPSNEIVQLYIDRVSACHIAEKIGSELLFRAGVMIDGVVMEIQKFEITLTALFALM